MSARQSELLAVESPEGREARLQRMSARQSERLAVESPGEREARLRRTTVRERERLAAKTPQDREARLQQMSTQQHERVTEERVQDRVSSSQLYKERSVQQKMKKLHAYFSSLDSPRCSVCSESFPGLQLRSLSTECVRCSRDKHIPKVYSSANNMDPGPLPPQLQVNYHLCIECRVTCN